MTRKILFLDKAHPVLENHLTKIGFHCETDTTSDKAAIEARLSAYHGIVMRSRLTLDEQFIDRATRLRFIAREGVGVEHLPVAYAESKGIRVLTSPEGSRDTVAEHAMGMLLMLFNNLCRANREVKSNQWNREPNRGMELMGKTVGIIGYGNMGTAFARRLSGFGVRVLAYDKYKKNYGDEYAAEADLQRLYAEADVISLHIPMMEGNFHFVNETFLQHFKKDIYILNTARGLVLDTAALVRELKSGHVRGAALDVLEYEDQSFDKFRLDQLPDDFKYLQQAENVVLAPHIAGWSFESKKKHGEVLARKIEELDW